MGFLQLTPQNVAQARSLSYPEAFKLDRTLGYNPNFKGGVGPVKYGIEGFKSIFGFGDQKIGGATPLTRKVALDAADLAKSFGSKALNFLGKASIPLSVLSPTPLGADDMVTQEMIDSIDTTGINSLRGDYTRAPNTAFAELLSDIDKFDRSPASSGVRQTIGSRITEGLGSIRDKVGGGLEFLKNLSPVQNILNTVKRGDLSTRGIAGLNANDVFNIDMFGTEEDPTKDRYGYNIVSALGDYDKFVKDKAQQLAKMQFRTKSGKERQKFFQDAADAIREKERQKDLEEKRRLTARLSTVGRDSGGGFDQASYDAGKASAAAQEQSNRDAARGR